MGFRVRVEGVRLGLLGASRVVISTVRSRAIILVCKYSYPDCQPHL